MSVVVAYDRRGAGRGSRAVSLLDLIKFKTHVYAKFARAMSEQEQVLGKVGPLAPVTAEAAAGMRDAFGYMATICRLAGLHTAARAAEYAAEANHDRKAGEWRENLRTVRHLVERDLSEEIFFHMPRQRAAWFLGEEPFGPQAANAFPSAAPDMQEAARCFATERYTACVFHCMRVLEFGLGALARDVGRKYDRQQWQNVIEEIETEIKKVRSNGSSGMPKAEKDDKLRFWSEAAKEFAYFKDGWRNHVAHARSFHDEHSALSVLNHTQAFMAVLATGGLKE